MASRDGTNPFVEIQRLVAELNMNNRTPNISTAAKMSTGGQKTKTADISENPFFQKYKAKIQHMQDTNPEEYEQKLQELSDRLNPRPRPSSVSPDSSVDPPSFDKSKPDAPKVVPPSDVAREGVGMTKSKGLNSVMKVELLEDKTAEEITKIWNQYHSTKDCVFAVLKTNEFQNLKEKSKECPVFVFPIPRDDGFEFILCQFDRNDVYFTPLAMFQVVRENAPPCLTLTHYTELNDSKGIVLMTGQYDEKILNEKSALSLVQLMSIFYGKDSKFYSLVKQFNYEPETFKYQDVIDAFKSLPQHDIK